MALKAGKRGERDPSINCFLSSGTNKESGQIVGEVQSKYEKTLR